MSVGVAAGSQGMTLALNVSRSWACVYFLKFASSRSTTCWFKDFSFTLAQMFASGSMAKNSCGSISSAVQIFSKSRSYSGRHTHTHLPSAQQYMLLKGLGTSVRDFG